MAPLARCTTALGGAVARALSTSVMHADMGSSYDFATEQETQAQQKQALIKNIESNVRKVRTAPNNVIIGKIYNLCTDNLENARIQDLKCRNEFSSILVREIQRQGISDELWVHERDNRPCTCTCGTKYGKLHEQLEQAAKS